MSHPHVVLAEIARQSGTSLISQGSFNTLVSVSLRDISWRDAVESVAKACDLAVDWETPGIVVVRCR